MRKRCREKIAAPSRNRRKRLTAMNHGADADIREAPCPDSGAPIFSKLLDDFGEAEQLAAERGAFVAAGSEVRGDRVLAVDGEDAQRQPAVEKIELGADRQHVLPATELLD